MVSTVSRFTCRCGLLFVDEKIYISGGELGLGRGQWNEYIYEVNTVTRTITIVGQMPERRRHHMSCCTEDTLYIIGGLDRYRCKRQELFKLSLQSGMFRESMYYYVIG